MAKKPEKPSKPATRILIVDDHPIVVQGLSTLLAQEPDFEVCGTAEDVPTAIKLVDKFKPHVVTIDISLNEGSGLELIQRIVNRDQGIRMLVCSLYDETLFAERALHAGALGYVNKHEATRTIVQAIRQVLNDRVYLSDKMRERLAHRLIGGQRKVVRPAMDTLSDRELEVFQLIGQGQTSAEIAAKLHLGMKTVDTYRSRIKVKLKLPNMAQLSREAAQWVLGQR
jgi:DNA-binding NarL/FixJ family response regulator